MGLNPRGLVWFARVGACDREVQLATSKPKAAATGVFIFDRIELDTERNS